MEELKKLAQQLFSVRKNPVYLFDIEDITYRSYQDLQKHLAGIQIPVLDLILNSPGGDIDAAYHVIRILRRHCEKIVGIVPFWAKSATTLICLGMDELILGECAELGPLDTQIAEYQQGSPREYKSALNRFKALDQLQQQAVQSLDLAVKLILQRGGLKIGEAVSLATGFTSAVMSPLYSQVSPDRLGENARALEIGREYAMRILSRYMKWSEKKADDLVQKLVYQYPSHRFVLDVDELQSLGMKARYAEQPESAIIELIKDLIVPKSRNYNGFLFREGMTEKTKEGTNDGSLEANSEDEQQNEGTAEPAAESV